jgi:hypothetical protein
MSKKQKTGVVRPSDGADVSAKVNLQPDVDPVSETIDVKGQPVADKRNVVTETKVPKQVFNTKQVASIAPASSATLGGRAIGTFMAGGTAADNGLSSDRSGVSVQVTGDRRDTRIGKKTNSTARRLRTIVSEQVESHYQTSKPLAGNGDSVQGANGQPFNKHFHSQKTHGALPGDFNFERSVDIITRDELLYIDGQYNKLEGTELYDSVPLDGDHLAAPDDADGEIAKGDFVHKTMTITITPTNAVSLAIDVDDITPIVDDPVVAERAGKTAITQANQAELDRQIMESKAGDETQDNWSPLPLAVANPLGLVHLFKNIESGIGAELLLAHKKLNLAMAYTVNRTAKDGLTDTILDEVFNSVANKQDAQLDYVNYGWSNAAAFAAGSSAWVVAMNDTLNKYNFKSDLFTQPRALNLLLQTLDQNISPFKVKKDFSDLFHNREMFSTIGATYDPYLPIMVTDVEAAVHPINLSDFIDANGQPRAITYSWSDQRNIYTANVYHPLIKGIYDYVRYNATKLRSSSVFNTAASKNLVITVPMVHATTGFSAWSLLLAAAAPEIVRARISAFRDLNTYTDKNGYPFSGFISLEEAIKAPYRNFEFISREEPLKSRAMDSVHSISWTMPELFTMTYGINTEDAGATTTGSPEVGVLMPWYMAGEQYDTNGAPIDDVHIMAMPNIRSGATLGYLDALYAQDERTLRLCLDMLVAIPGYMADINKVAECSVYKIGRGSTGNPVVYYGSTPLSFGDILSTPRELGLSQVAPGNYLRLTQAYSGETAVDRTTLTTVYDGSTSYIAYLYAANESAAPAVNGVDPLNAMTADGLSQYYYCVPATAGATAHEMTRGIAFTLRSLFKTAVDPDSTNTAHIIFKDEQRYNPIIANDNTAPTNLANISMFSFVKALWLRIQRLPFGLSPWDSAWRDEVSYIDGTDPQEDDSYVVATIDPYEFLYYFGLAGFSASDYTEDVYNRLNKIQVEGIVFTSDLFVEDSLLTK